MELEYGPVSRFLITPRRAGCESCDCLARFAGRLWRSRCDAHSHSLGEDYGLILDLRALLKTRARAISGMVGKSHENGGENDVSDRFGVCAAVSGAKKRLADRKEMIAVYSIEYRLGTG